MRSPARRGNAEDRANWKSLTGTVDSTKPAAPPDLATMFVAQSLARGDDPAATDKSWNGGAHD